MTCCYEAGFVHFSTENIWTLGWHELCKAASTCKIFQKIHSCQENNLGVYFLFFTQVLDYFDYDFCHLLYVKAKATL